MNVYRKIFNLTIVAGLLAYATLAKAAVDTDMLARHLLEIGGKSKGICLLMRGGELSLALAKHSELLVVDQEDDAKATMALRDAAEAAGVLGRTVYVAESAESHPVLADNYANLVVVWDATDATMAQLDVNALLRVTTPHGGQVLVGHAAGAAGTLTEEKLAAWAQGSGLPHANINLVADAGGVWAKLRKPQLPGAAEWTHRLFDSSFNPVSTDSAFTMPSMTQWLDTPYNEGAGAPRIAGGRLLMVMEGKYYERSTCEVNWLIMRDAYNGRVLWKRDLGDGPAADWFLSSCVLTADTLYLMDLGTANVLVLDPETGKEMRKIDCSALGGMVKWLALQDGVLYVGVGGKETNMYGGYGNLGMTSAEHLKFILQSDDAVSARTKQSNCGVIAALRASDGQVLWQHKEDTDCIPECLIAVRKGHVYFLAQEKYAACLDSATGKVLWTAPEAAATFKKQLYALSSLGTGALMAVDDTMLIERPGSSRIAINTADGKVLWDEGKFGDHSTSPTVTTMNKGALIWDKYVLGTKCVNLRTGEEKFKGIANPYIGACDFLCATQHYITGQPGATFDLQMMKPVKRPDFFHKAPCSMGSVVGEGILFISSFHCDCSYQLNGNIIEMAGDGRQYQQPAVEAERLRVPPPGATPAPLPITAEDWPAARGGNSRSNASLAHIPEQVTQRWSAALSMPYANPAYPSDRSETSYEACQPLCVGQRIFTGGPDGTLRCLDLATGQVVWTYRTGGQIFNAPAIWEGRLYSGSGDGFIYCLEAATGVELWRFQAAPVERRIMVYGHLVSTWPVAAGALVQDGVLYAAASLINYNATHVYALDAKSGKIIWQNNSSGFLDTLSENGASAVGTMTVAQGRLWIRTASYDLKTGDFRLHADPKNPRLAKIGNGMSVGGNALLNRDTGTLAGGKFLLFGGRRFFESQSRPAILGRSPTPFSIVELGADGQGIFPQLDLTWATTAFAAWDDRQVVLAPALEDAGSINGAIRHSPVLCWDTAKLLDFVRTARDDPNWTRKWQAPPMLNCGGRFETITQFPMHQWLLDSHYTYAVALAANAVVVANGMQTKSEKMAAHWLSNVPIYVSDTFTLQACDRQTGKVLWHYPLPSAPVLDGISIARDGSVVVQMLDGGVLCYGK